MRSIKLFLLSAFAAVFFISAAPSRAQVSFGVSIGNAPMCPYGYYDFAPYNCAPYGYYGPEWFSNGVFIGAGPWFHAGPHFHGHVNYAYDPRHGYHGPYPARGEHWHDHGDNWNSFHASHYYDGHGYHADHDWHGYGHDHDHDRH